MCHVHNWQYYVKKQTAYSPVKLRVTSFFACKHNVEHQKSEHYAKHTNKFKQWCSCHKTISLFFCCLNQSCNHNTKTKEIADVGKINVKIPTDSFYIIKNTQTSNAPNYAKCAIYCLKNKLCCFVFNHNKPFITLCESSVPASLHCLS